jgi:hypothetical protein
MLLTSEPEPVELPPPGWQSRHDRLLQLYARLPIKDQQEMLTLARLKIQLRELNTDDLA